MNPKVSVIIPTYNRAKWLLEALESVFKQTRLTVGHACQDYEIIVVDDGSTDNTKEVLKPYLDKIIYLYKENGGVSSARNLGIKHSRGEFIACLDSDDLWFPDKLRLQVEYLEKHPEIGLVFCWYELFDEDKYGNKIKKYDYKYTGEDISFWKLLTQRIDIMAPMFRRVCLDKAGLFDESFTRGEDTDLWLRIAKHYPIGKINQILTRYRLHPLNKVRFADSQGQLATRLRILKKMVDLYPDITEELYHYIKELETRMFKIEMVLPTDQLENSLIYRTLLRFCQIKKKLFPDDTRRHAIFNWFLKQVRKVI